MTDDPVNNAHIPVTNSESPSMPIKIIVSPSKKFQPSLTPSAQQPFVPQQQIPMVIYYYYFYYYICYNKLVLYFYIGCGF